MENRKFWSYENKLLIILCFVWGFVFVDRLALNFLLPFINEDLHLTNTQIGLIVSAFSLTWALSGYFGGALSDKTGKKKSILIASVLLFSLCSFLSGIAATFVMLLIFRMLMGVFEGPVLPIAQSMLSVESSESRRGFNMGLLQSSSTALLANVLGPIMIVALAAAFGWRNTFFFTMIPGLLLCFLIWKIVREPKPSEHSIHKSAEREGSKEKIQIKELLKNRNILISILISPFFISWYIELFTFSPLYLVNDKQLSSSAMSYVMSALGIGGFLWGFAIPAISDRLGRKPVMIASSFVAALAPIGFIYLGGSSLWVLALIGFIGNVGVGAHVLTLSTIPSESIPSKYAATAIGLIMGIGELTGGVLVTTLAGMAGDRFGLSAPLLISFACAVIAALLSFLYYETAPVKVKKQSSGQPINTVEQFS